MRDIIVPYDQIVASNEYLKNQLIIASTGTIFFESGSFNITPDGMDKLFKIAELLKGNPDQSITIEGHTDGRGTNKYNLALGCRRAESVKRFLVYLGIDSSRISPISYGEDRPVGYGEDRPVGFTQIEEALAINRRVHFVFE